MVAAARTVKLGLPMAGALMTPAEFDAVTQYDDRYRYELVNGVLVVTALPKAMETGPNEMLGYWLIAYREQHPKGKSLDCTLPQQYVRTRRSRRIADRLIWTGLGRMPNRTRDVASIAVEFVSKGRRNRQRDYIHKKREYMKVGITEYWIVDRFQRIMTVIHNESGKSRTQVIQEHETYRPTLLPGFKLIVKELLDVADRFEAFE